MRTRVRRSAAVTLAFAVLATTACTATEVTPETVVLPRAAVADASIVDWVAAPQTQIADVLPQVGAAADGDVAAFIDAPAVDGAVDALSTTIAVQPGTTYDFVAQARVLSPERTDVPASVRIGDTTIALPALGIDWTEVKGAYQAGDESSVKLSIVVDGAVTGLGIDDLSLTPAGGGDNIVPNPSFEDVDAPRGVLSDSLVLRQDSAALAVKLAPGDASWVARRYEDDSTVEGHAVLREGVAAVPLEGVTQGYYTIEITDASGTAVSTPIAVVDYKSARMPLDERIGVGLHVERKPYAGAAEYAAALGFGSGRNDVRWALNETTAGTYTWDKTYVDEFAKLHVHGLGVLAIADYGNPLYTKAANLPPSTPEAIEAFGRYAGAIAERFDVVGVEVYNEYNHEPMNKGPCGRTADCYLPLLQAVEKNVEAVDPGIPVVAGVTANSDRAFFDRLWQLGGLSNSDAASFHPYDIYDTPDEIAATVSNAHDDMQANGGGSVPVWITELGWTTKSQGAALDAQSYNLIRAETRALGAGAAKYFWYDLVNDSADPADHEGNFGLFEQRRAGLRALPPKPAAFAQALLIAKIAGHDDASLDDLGEGVRSVRFADGDDVVRVAWTSEGTRTVEYAATDEVTVTDAWGKTSAVRAEGDTVTVQLSTTPVFIEGRFAQ